MVLRTFRWAGSDPPPYLKPLQQIIRTPVSL
jgi:hypothetical protein